MNPNVQTEQALLGILLLEGTKIKETRLEPHHFSNSGHRRIFTSMRNVDGEGVPVDMVTVTTDLGDGIEEVGGVGYLLEMTQAVPTTVNFHFYEKLLINAYAQEKVRKTALSYIENPNGNALDQLKKELVHIEAGEADPEPTIRDQLTEIATEMTGTSGQTGHPTGFSDYDKMTGGAQRGDLIIVAARPSMGKTAFALNIAMNHCKNGGAVDLFSLEMGTKHLLQRMISTEARIDGQKWRSMCFSNEDYKRSFYVIGEIAEWNLSIHERSQTLHDITTRIRKTAETHDNPLVIIDYLQLITTKGRHERRDLEIGTITRELKLLARELNLPIILLSQLSRGVEQRQDKRPMMSDLRESGNIEQDADVISFLYRDDYYTQAGSDAVEVILRKQRNGPVGTVVLGFEKEYGRFGG
ncbi:replicative DNA helicase [Halobacillus fulvus]|nr:replicative DNA helicase [Halobacillus fulvus]